MDKHGERKHTLFLTADERKLKICWNSADTNTSLSSARITFHPDPASAGTRPLLSPHHTNLFICPHALHLYIYFFCLISQKATGSNWRPRSFSKGTKKSQKNAGILSRSEVDASNSHWMESVFLAFVGENPPIFCTGNISFLRVAEPWLMTGRGVVRTRSQNHSGFVPLSVKQIIWCYVAFVWPETACLNSIQRSWRLGLKRENQTPTSHLQVQ